MARHGMPSLGPSTYWTSPRSIDWEAIRAHDERQREMRDLARRLTEGIGG